MPRSRRSNGGAGLRLEKGQDVQPCDATLEDISLVDGLVAAGGVVKSADKGDTAFQWQGQPKAFVLVTQGKLTVHFRKTGQRLAWAECRATQGQDCMPVTAAILSGSPIAISATCTAPCSWIELAPKRFHQLVDDHLGFRRALFAAHANRLPKFFARVSAKNVLGFDQRLADWLLGHVREGAVVATHGDIAAELLTAREVVSRGLRDFAVKGWITQERGCIFLEAPAALARVSKGYLARPSSGSRPRGIPAP
ncbi:putative transcriptional regulator [Dinoroseobacter shibae DFL 12 = DSM 16493]|jgi:CRP/FNR family transcriptional regulator|uniref:Putative transcriptional regulator n=1 Tax=Dinoroseobacter shibae (strain DSM 16493 / NCIMB 14021 / DFL 12) TaxID=398580 RepID=A8LSR2_DINSH|nr:putative transcriptional regulator [Dinoroseobacter shibae DFL 12 = DSM 16493]